MGTNSDFGSYLKKILLENNITMTKLSDLTQIDKATISRIANNKQIPTNKHLKKISAALNIPFNQLFSIINDEYSISETDNKTTNTNSSDENIILNFSSILDNTDLSDKVQQELLKYEELMNTKDGKTLITNDFNTKINNISQTGPFVTTLKNLYNKFCNESLSKKEFILIGAVLLYFILPLDIIPDFIFPIGFIDDMIAVNLLTSSLLALSQSSDK